MANTYFSLKKEVEYPEDKVLERYRYTNSYELSLTAFLGNDNTGNVQLTVQTTSTDRSQISGTAFITLNDKEIDLLIAGLLERKLGLIKATSDNQSMFSPAE